MQILIVAPQGAGKEEVARKIADALGLDILDDGDVTAVSPSGRSGIVTSNAKWVRRGRDSTIPEYVRDALGKLADAEIEDITGIHYQRLWRERQRLGIPKAPRCGTSRVEDSRRRASLISTLQSAHDAAPAAAKE
jgi:hypothetical protein